MSLRVIVVDDHPMLRRSVRWACENSATPMDVVGEAGNGPDCLALAAELDPDVIVLDLELPGMHGLDVLTELRHAGSRAKVLILTAGDQDDLLFEALSREADGFLDKTVGPTEICNAIASVGGGDRVLTQEQEALFMDRFGEFLQRSRGRGTDAVLTSDEATVIERLAEGHTTRRIAGSMHVSVRTVESHITRLYKKIGASNRVELVRLARAAGHISRQTVTTGP